MTRAVKKRGISFILTLAMVLSLFPAMTLTASAAGGATFDFENSVTFQPPIINNRSKEVHQTLSEGTLVIKATKYTLITSAELGGLAISNANSIFTNFADETTVIDGAHVGGPDESQLSVSLLDGKAFDLKSLILVNYNDAIRTMVLTSNKGSQAISVECGETKPVNLSVDENFKQITSFTITEPNKGVALGIDDIVVDNINTPPVVSVTPTPIAYTDTAENDTFTSATGTITATDADADGIKSYGISGGTLGANNDVSKTLTYGTLHVDSSTGTYVFVPNNDSINALDDSVGVVVDDVKVTATDNRGATGQISLTISVTGVNDTPTDITMNKQTVKQSGGVNAIIGRFTTTDAEKVPSGFIKYALVSGSGGNDSGNSLFQINDLNNELCANDAAAMAAGDYHVFVQAKDTGGATYQKAFVITVEDDVAPTVTVTAGSTAGGDGRVNTAEKKAGFQVVARSSEASGTLYVVPSTTVQNATAITSAGGLCMGKCGYDHRDRCR